MAPSYKLYYFDSRGRAEYARLLFAAAGVEYTDVRVTKEEWPAMKPKMPFGQLPVLEEGSKDLVAQSYTILRYLGKQFGFYGKTAEDAVQIDQIIDCQEDFQQPLIKFAREQDKDKKAEYKKNFEENLQDYMLQKFEDMLVANNGGDGWFIGDKMTVADLAFYHGTSWPMEVFGMHTPWDKFPKLAALKDRVVNDPRIKTWLETRPKTPW